jgi:putative membrane protein
MKIQALALISALALPAVALADDSTATDNHKTTTTDKAKGDKLSDGDARIVSHLHHVNQMEIDLGKAAQKSGTAKVKAYATTLVTDHQSADQDLTAFAKKHNLGSIAADKPQSDADKQDQKDMDSQASQIKKLKGADFDRQYLNMMVAGHDKELANIDTSMSAASDPDLQSFLKAVKPVLQRHADEARDLQNSPQASADMPRSAPSN